MILKTEKLKILAVEDNAADARLIEEFLKEGLSGNFDFKHSATLEEASAALSSEKFDVVLLDLNLPDGRGVDNIDRVYSATRNTPIIVLTGLEDEKAGMMAVQKGAQDYLIKGKIASDTLIRSIRYAMERKRTEMELRSSRAAALSLMEDALQARKQAETVAAALTESEKRYRDLVKYAPAGIYEIDINTMRFIEVNDIMCQILGYTREELLSIEPGEMLDEEGRERFKGRMAAVLAGEDVSGHTEYRVRTKDGREVWAVLNVTVNYTDKKPRSVSIVAHDITERKHAEEKILQAKEEWERTFESVPDLIAILDKEHRIVRVNKAMAEKLGTSAEKAIGLRCYEVVHGMKTPHDICPHLLTCADGKEHVAEVHEDRLGGDFLVSTTPLYDMDGSLIGSVHVARDITASKRAEKALRDAENDLSRAQEVAHTGSWRLDVDTNKLTWSEETYRIFGIPKGTPLTYEVFLSFVHPDDRENVGKAWERGLAGAPYDVEHRILVNGKVKWVREKAYLESDKNSRLKAGFGISQDITDKKIAEEAVNSASRQYEILAQSASELLQASEPQKVMNALCRKVMEHIDCQIFFNFMSDKKSGKLRLNAYAGIPEKEAERIEWIDYGTAVCGCAARDACRIVVENIPGYNDARAELVKSYGVKAYACHPILGSDEEVLGTLSFGSKKKSAFTDEELSFMKSITDMVAVALTRMISQQLLKEAHDSLERKVVERTRELVSAQIELDRTKRLSDIGTLAATVAHELRNPLAAINMAASNIKRKAQNPSLDKHLTNIEKKVLESDQIINNLLFYSRIKPPQRESVNLNHIITECVEYSQKQFEQKKKIAFKKNLGFMKDIIVDVDAFQMKEVFSNIINNSCDAVPESRGRIEIFAESGKDSVNIGIKDNGHGIATEHINRIFDPFFTTKAKGTGLGLSVCQQIVNMHGGSIRAESEPGKWTLILITLPAKEGKMNG